MVPLGTVTATSPAAKCGSFSSADCTCEAEALYGMSAVVSPLTVRRKLPPVVFVLIENSSFSFCDAPAAWVSVTVIGIAISKFSSLGV